MTKVLDIQRALRSIADPKRQKISECFFKTGKGQYGEHDRFLGITNPHVRHIAREYKDLSLSDCALLLDSPYNEERLCALVILVERFKKSVKDPREQKQIFDLYLKNIDQINNWNLVDLSAPHIIGEYIYLHPNHKKYILQFIRSDIHWPRRIGIVATWAFIKRNEHDLTLTCASELLRDTEDLMHKAVGWMLREVWKRNASLCESFLQKNYENIPRTTLRYAIERMDEDKRKKYLKGQF
jgi:3-methyladenine DNA glycosylase AlkD